MTSDSPDLIICFFIVILYLFTFTCNFGIAAFDVVGLAFFVTADCGL